MLRSVVFVAVATVWLYAASWLWWYLVALPAPLTVGVIAWEMATARYHGVFARRINRRLDEYLVAAREAGGGSDGGGRHTLSSFLFRTAPAITAGYGRLHREKAQIKGGPPCG